MVWGVDGTDASHRRRDSQGNVSNAREENGWFHRSAMYLEVAGVEVFFNDDVREFLHFLLRQRGFGKGRTDGALILVCRTTNR